MRTNATKSFPGRITEKLFTRSMSWESFHEMFLRPVWTFICLIKQKANRRSLDAIRRTAVWENPTHRECEASIPALAIERNSASGHSVCPLMCSSEPCRQGWKKVLHLCTPPRFKRKSSCLGQIGSHEVWVNINSSQNWEQKSKKKYWKLAINLCLRRTCGF